MPELIGEVNPNPHFPIEVNQGSGEYFCAVGDCKKHKYPRKAPSKLLVPATFYGGNHPGPNPLIKAQPSIMRGKEEYVLDIWEKSPYGASAVYYPAEEMK